MKLYIASDDGELLDYVQLTREEFESAQANGITARSILRALQLGIDAK